MMDSRVFTDVASNKDFKVDILSDKVTISYILPGERLFNVDNDIVQFFDMDTGDMIDLDLTGAVYNEEEQTITNDEYYRIEIIDKIS